MLDAFIYAGVRTPFGRAAGALSRMRPDDLLAQAVAAAVADSGFPREQFEDVVAGCANQAGEDARNVARHAALRAGLPVGVAGIAVNRLCGSGLAAVLDAARAAHAGQGELFVAGGVESMSRAPFVFAKNEAPFGRDVRVFDSTIGARFPNPAIERAFGADTMPQTADNIAADLNIGRDETDVFAAASQFKYAAANAVGFFDGEIRPVEIAAKAKGKAVAVSADEHPRPETTIETLAALKPLHAGGVVTAGNASGVNDGAAALIIGTRAAGLSADARPRGRIVSGAVAGVAPRVMGLGPVPACEKALVRAGLTLADMDVIEINEAFAAQVLGCCRLMGLAGDDPRLNPNGGAIAIGHPLGASGARITLTALRQLERTGGRYALVSMCIGVGQGVAAVIQRLD